MGRVSSSLILFTKDKCGILVQVRAEARTLVYAERSRGCRKFRRNFAEIAQLVEHNLAKVRVASSSLVFRSKKVLHVRHWKGGRVVDYSGLENRRAERHRGFESLPFRRERATKVARFSFM